MMMIKFLLLSLVLMISSVNAGKELMIEECHNADVPTLCMLCLESNPASFRANSVGIADIIIHCLDSGLNILTKNITELLPFEKDVTLKNILKDCKRNLMNATDILNDGRRALKTGNYDKATNSITVALTLPLGCESDLQTVTFEYYQYYSEIINIYGQLSNAAMRMIDRF